MKMKKNEEKPKEKEEPKDTMPDCPNCEFSRHIYSDLDNPEVVCINKKLSKFQFTPSKDYNCGGNEFRKIKVTNKTKQKFRNYR